MSKKVLAAVLAAVFTVGGTAGFVVATYKAQSELFTPDEVLQLMVKICGRRNTST